MSGIYMFGFQMYGLLRTVCVSDDFHQISRNRYQSLFFVTHSNIRSVEVL